MITLTLSKLDALILAEALRAGDTTASETK